MADEICNSKGLTQYFEKYEYEYILRYTVPKQTQISQFA